MRKGFSHRFVNTGDGFESSFEFQNISPYLIPLSDAIIEQDPNILEKFIKHLNKSKKLIDIEITKQTELISSLHDTIDYPVESDFLIPEKNETNKDIRRILLFLIQKIQKYNVLCLKERIDTIDKHRIFLHSFQPLILHLLDKGIPVILKISRILSPQDRTLFSFQKLNNLKLTFLKRVANKYYLLIQLVPPPFRSQSSNQMFFHQIVNTGLLSRKTSTTYFPELPEEHLLHIFLKSNFSPLIKEGLYPILNIENNSDFIKSWIDLATIVLAEYDKTEDQDRAQTIAILAMRFFFSITYPLFYPNITNSQNLFEKMEKFSEKTPNNIGILKKFIPKNFGDKPIKEMFNKDDISKEPTGWLKVAEFQICPVDAAFCIVKAHESLSLMAVLISSNANHPSEVPDFMDKMPGFDDIFDLWLSLLAVSSMSDPLRLWNFINKYTNLPGFTGRILSSIAYFEASVTQFVQDDN